MKRILLKRIFLISIILLLFISFDTSIATQMSSNTKQFLNSQMQTSNSIKTINGVDITSRNYLISELYSYIGRILPKTTIKQFKSNFNVPSENIHIYKDKNMQEEVQDGYMGTNMAVKFDNIDKVYEISTVGDLDGDGLSNQIEIQKIIKYIVYGENEELEGLKLLSADVNGDSTINQVDLSILINYVVFGRLSINEVNKPQKPTIEVISGETSENGIYVTEVTVKITPTETENVEKTTYTISGSMEVEETPIPANGQITLSNDGTYTIRSYTYFTDGARSDAAELVIRKSIKGILDENIGIIIKLDNKDGEDYDVGEWTNHNICIETMQTKEEFGNNAEVTIETKYTISGAKQMPIPTKAPTLLTNSGEYVITAIATDEFGRIKTKEYIVKIDKDKPENTTISIQEEKKESGYYNQDVNVTVNHGNDALSGLDKVTYELSGAQTVAETDIENNGEIKVTNDGYTKMIIRSYDKVGNIATLEEDINLDKVKPDNITLQASDITSTSFNLTATAHDEVSGIKKYEFYVDDNLYKTETTLAETVTIPVTELKTTKHRVKVVVTDNAENSDETSTEVANLKLQEHEIDSIVFEITDFDIIDGEGEVNTNFEKVISDTSLTDQSKYIQLSTKANSENGLTGEIKGKVKAIRTDGIEIEELEFLPENLELTVGYESDGSGNSFNHKTNAEIFGETVKNEESATERIVDIQKIINIGSILDDRIAEKNNFKIIEKKTNGVTSLTRLIIKKITIGEKEVGFKIIDSSQNT